MNDQKLKAWEIAMLAALCVFFCAGMWAERTQSELADSLVRLHVVANSDSPDDQAEKLQMRDKVLSLLSPLLEGREDRNDIVDIILNHKADIEALGDVSVTLEEEYYPTRHYNTFSLPAGNYLSLRVTVGEGAGQNWWCVVFPPLCTEALAEPSRDVFQDLSQAQTQLITQDGEGYIIRFRVLEWWGKLAEALS